MPDISGVSEREQAVAGAVVIRVLPCVLCSLLLSSSMSPGLADLQGLSGLSGA